jgi:hypothetical protein
MTPEEIKKMQEENIALKQQVNDLGIEKTKLVTDITERDTTIADLKKNAEERGQQFKKFKEMNEAEKELLSEKEKEILQRQDALEEARQKDVADRDAFNKKVKDTTIANLANRLAKGDKDLAEQIKINLGKLSPELLSKAQTEEELTPYVQDAFNMTGAHSTGDPLREAINTDGLPAKVEGEKDFSTTKEGQDLGKAMGLSSFNSEAK